MKHTGVLLSLALLAACCLASCIHTDDTLGSALVPSSQDITIQTATLDLPLQGMRASDDLQSRVTGSVTVGNIGTDFYSEGLMTITASTDSIVWGKNPTVQRVYLSMVRDTALVMRDDQLYIPQNIYVHRLNFELDSTHVNATHDRFKGQYYDPEPISTGGFVYTGDDAWSVELKKEIGEELLRFPMATLDSAQLFMKQFYGICLRGDYPESSLTTPDGEGRLNLFDLSSSYMIITWDYDGRSGRPQERDRLLPARSLSCASTSTGSCGNVRSPPDQRCILVQGLSGSKPYVSARALKESVEDWAGAGESPDGDICHRQGYASNSPSNTTAKPNQFDNYAASLYPCQRTSWTTTGSPITPRWRRSTILHWKAARSTVHNSTTSRTSACTCRICSARRTVTSMTKTTCGSCLPTVITTRTPARPTTTPTIISIRRQPSTGQAPCAIPCSN